MTPHHIFRHGRFHSTLRTLSLAGGSLLAGCQIASSPLLFENEDTCHCSLKVNNNADDTICTVRNRLREIHSVFSRFSRLLEANRSSLEPASKPASRIASENNTILATSVRQRKTCLEPGKAIGSVGNTALYDFVIVGYGNAGQSALRTLQEQCPGARVALVDPLRSPNKGTKGKGVDTDYFRDTVVEFDPSSKTLRLLAADPSRRAIRYKHGVLIATGARGAPPPLELFQEESLPRVLELRPTELFRNTKRPAMAPEKVRNAVAEAAAKGAKIAVLGSGWEALDLLLVAERACKSTKRRPTMCFASSGIAWHTLPPYLSAELRKKLGKREVDVQDRSFVRYVADYQQSNRQQIELHTAKTYDLMDTRRTALDLLVVAPDSFGDKGTAALPTMDVPESMKESSDGRPWYKTWSQMARRRNAEPSALVCFEDDGRISVNAELHVASRIYAAGGCAKYPNSSTGHSCIAGEGSIDGSEAGRLAALNMSRDYRLATRASSSYGFSSSGDDIEEAHSFATNSLPIWRSDITSFPACNGDRISSLSSIGVQALCVGKCDSERQSTRAFWWTNSSARRKMNRFIKDESESSQDDDGDDGKDEDVDEGSIRRRKSLVISRHKTGRVNSRGLVKPVYGVGVVFYLDHYGRIQGIMTWGLPFADRPGGKINPELLEHMKHMIASNAGVSALDAEDNHQLVNLALGKASQKLVALSVKDQVSHTTRTWHGLDGPIQGFATPLYRYTEVSNSRNKTVNVLKRKDGSGLGVLGEGLYVRDDFVLEEVADNGPGDHLSEEENEDASPANIPTTMYPITVAPASHHDDAYGKKEISLETMKELNRYLAVQLRWEANENRARPGKEDPLWLRPGDERKNTSGKQNVIDAYRRIMFPHQSS
ncbi:unnamed protein product [Pseudo-nitzschia multistriata]|uniref:FAD/NAD(P)-binding domain-containing protein n=1 Tax=Pseudo-nitzschia multistriata TaxID=183589 RepID=A0A448Z5R3_9STRA|nr:unnamed protein product [Pseudo-nitzschia multistriata]